MMAAINAQVDAALQAGQITTIAPTSVLAYELGWGGATKGATKSVYGLTFTFDGSNWTLASAPSPSGPYANAAGNCPIGYINTTGGPNGLCVQSVGIGSYGMGKRTMTHARRINYQRKSRFA